jgi:hypothetical protein
MRARDFDALARGAAADVAAFARFIEQGQALLAEAAEAGARESYASVWFDAEILNALALERWESEGRPTDWQAPWRADFQRDAAQAVAALREAAAALLQA